MALTYDTEIRNGKYCIIIKMQRWHLFLWKLTRHHCQISDFSYIINRSIVLNHHAIFLKRAQRETPGSAPSFNDNAWAKKNIELLHSFTYWIFCRKNWTHHPVSIAYGFHCNVLVETTKLWRKIHFLKKGKITLNIPKEIVPEMQLHVFINQLPLICQSKYCGNAYILEH